MPKDEAKTSDKILRYIEAKGQASGNELADYLMITPRGVRKHLNNLLAEGKLSKIGKPPKVFYLLAEKEEETEASQLDSETERIINENFIVITPAGIKKEGLDGFRYWCDRQKLPLVKTASEYRQTLGKYARYKKDGLIDGKYKIKHTFNQVFMDKVFYLDFYSIERFGKTKLGQMLLYAKQSQDKILIRELVEQIKPKIISLIERLRIDAVGYIPPTVKREVQFMKELQRHLNLSVPVVNLIKVKTPVAVPQKTLNKLEDRVENARSTIIVNETRKYRTVLLLDDALGSGATLNETARQIKEQDLAQTIIGLAITGSFSGFEVISEV